MGFSPVTVFKHLADTWDSFFFTWKPLVYSWPVKLVAYFLLLFFWRSPTSVWVSVRAELSTLFLQQPNRQSLLLSSIVSLSAALSSAAFVCRSPSPSAGPVLLLFSCKTLMVIGWTLLICISPFTENKCCHWTPAVLNELSIYFTATRMCSWHTQSCVCMCMCCPCHLLSPKYWTDMQVKTSKDCLELRNCFKG